MVSNAPDRILFVDDDRAACWMMEKLLGRLGYKVDVAGLAQVALKLVEESDFALVILDFMLPEMNGLELFRRMQKFRPGLRGIFLTGYAAPASEAARLEDGVEMVLEKPLVLEELAPVLQDAVWKCMNRA